MKKRLEKILTVLQTKEYLDNSNNSEKESNKLSKLLIKNPVKNDILIKPLQESFIPLFNYFEEMYDPIYSFIEKYIEKQSAINIDELLKVLHVMNNIPSKNYGIYKLTNVSQNMIKLMSELINSTKKHGEILKSQENGDNKEEEFYFQLENLPFVNLLSIVDFKKSLLYTNSSKIPFTGIFTMGSNLIIPTEDEKDELIEKTKKSHNISNEIDLNIDTIYSNVSEYFNDKNLYIICNGKTTDMNKIPTKLFEIDLNSIELRETTLIYKESDNPINKIIINEQPLFLNDILNVDTKNTVNSGELALTILIAFKELMPQ
jgi:hypothetical protein